MPRKRFSLLLTLLLGSVLAISGVATTATAAGSDSPVPYTVSAGGLTLPVGHIFSANQEINYTVSKLNGTGKQTLGVGNNIPHNGVWPQDKYIGASFYAWTDHPSFPANYLTDGYCITWVQVGQFNEHFGEGGQAPVCWSPPEEDCQVTATWSYSYDRSNNSGTVTQSAGEDCGKALYITATSWNYTRDATWPQVLNETFEVLVDHEGTFPFSAPVVCGQGDIYASWEDFIVPTDVLLGPAAWEQDNFLHSVRPAVTGFDSPTYMTTPTSCWSEPEPDVATAQLSVTDPTCGARGGVTLGAVVGAEWGEIQWDDEGNYTVVATALEDHLFPEGEGVSPDRTTRTFTGNLGKLTDGCEQLAVVGDPTFVPAQCGLPGSPVVPGSYTVVVATGVTYTVELGGAAAQPISPGTYTVSEFPASVRIVAHAAGGYTLGDAQSVWSFEFTAPTVCDLPDLDLVTPEIAYTQLSCTANGSYTLGGENVAWTVDGSEQPAGTYPVTSSQTVSITASPVEPHGFAPEQQTEWELEFTEPEAATCDELTTLPLTGSDLLMVGSGAAFVLLGLGAMLVGIRRQFA